MFEDEFLKYTTLECEFVAQKPKAMGLERAGKEPGRGSEEGKALTKSITVSCSNF